MKRLAALFAAGAAAAALGVGRGGRSPQTGALAVLSTHVTYEASLVDVALPRLPAPQARAALAVRALASAQASQLSALLARRGYPAAKAGALWARLIGDGAPAPGRAVYVCSVHLQSDRAQLAATPPGQLGVTLGAIELTLFVEGQQLSSQVGGGLGASGAAAQREALRLLSPLLIASDRAFAAAA